VPGQAELLWEALLAPRAAVLVRGQALRALVIYLGACAAILSVTGYLVYSQLGAIRSGLVAFVLPEAWQLAGEILIEGVFAKQERVVLINAVVQGALMLVTLTLFPLKERVSYLFERQRALCQSDPEEHPLWEQAWEEIKLFALVLAAQSSVFWIGYGPGETRKGLSIALSFLLLAITFSIDFVSPLLQRRRGYYSQILKTLARRPLATLAFGVLVSSPIALASAMVAAHPEWSLATSAGRLFAVEIAVIAVAVVGGTQLAAAYLPVFASSPRSRPAGRAAAWLFLLALIGVNVYVDGALLGSLVKKTQILRCKYAADLGSFEIEGPSIDALLDQRAGARMSLVVTIDNPTQLPVELESNRLELRHRGKLTATSALSPLRVDPGRTLRERVAFEIGVDLSLLERGRELLEGTHWTLTLYVQVAEHFEFPIYLIE